VRAAGAMVVVAREAGKEGVGAGVEVAADEARLLALLGAVMAEGGRGEVREAEVMGAVATAVATAEEATVAVVSVVAARAEAATEAVRAVAALVAASVAERAAVALWVETLDPRLSAQIHRRQ
jgi:hypothetical protein